MSQVWSRLDCSGAELLLALALADFADDLGRNLFPSVATLAHKTRQSTRTVQRQLAEFRDVEWLLVEDEDALSGGRGRSVRYRINPTWLNGDSLSWFSNRKGDTGDTKGCQPAQERVTPEVGKGDTAMSPDPSYPSLEPPVTREGDSAKVLTLSGDPYQPATEAEAISEIFAYWASVMNKPKVVLDEKRRNLIRNRLREGWTPEQLHIAIAGNAGDEWSQGANDRGKPFNELSLILRDAEHIERFIELAKCPRRPRSKATKRTEHNIDAAREFMQQTEPEAGR